jgi:hypothetical protein
LAKNKADNGVKRLGVFVAMALSLALSGCDPGHVLYVHNRSVADRQVRVIYTSATMQQEVVRSRSPFIRFYSTSGNGKVIKQNPLRVLRKDSITKDWVHTYSFLLPAGQTAGIEGGIGGPPKQLIIVDGRDSISTDTGSRRLRSRKFFFPLHFVHSIDIDD